MAWLRVDPAQRLEDEILALRETQRAAQVRLQDAEQIQVEALTLEQRAQDQLNRARLAATEARDVVEDCAREIGDRQDELKMYLPRQRPGS